MSRNLNRRSIYFLLVILFISIIYCECASQTKVTKSSIKSSVSKSLKKSPFKKKSKLGTVTMIKSFFMTMFDPEYGLEEKGALANSNIKRTNSGGASFGAFSSGGSSGFGPVCGPNGCV